MVKGSVEQHEGEKILERLLLSCDFFLLFTNAKCHVNLLSLSTRWPKQTLMYLGTGCVLCTVAVI